MKLPLPLEIRTEVLNVKLMKFLRTSGGKLLLWLEWEWTPLKLVLECSMSRLRLLQLLDMAPSMVGQRTLLRVVLSLLKPPIVCYGVAVALRLPTNRPLCMWRRAMCSKLAFRGAVATLCILLTVLVLMPLNLQASMLDRMVRLRTVAPLLHLVATRKLVIRLAG